MPVHELDLIVHGPVGDPAGEQPEQDVVEALVHHFDTGTKRLFAHGRSRERQFGLFQIERILDVVGAVLEHGIHIARRVRLDAAGDNERDVELHGMTS